MSGAGHVNGGDSIEFHPVRMMNACGTGCWMCGECDEAFAWVKTNEELDEFATTSVRTVPRPVSLCPLHLSAADELGTDAEQVRGDGGSTHDG